MNRNRFVSRCVIVGLTFVCLSFVSMPSFAAGCAITNCYVCVFAGIGDKQLCVPADSADGRLCCTAYASGDCRTFDDYCYGIIVRDV